MGSLQKEAIILKKSLGLILLFFSIFALTTEAIWKKTITMLMVPRDAKVIQIAQDVSRHYPTLIVCYQTVQNELNLHAWNGKGWIHLPVEDYINGSFCSNQPQHIIWIEPENSPAADLDLLVPNGFWCKSGHRLLSTEPRQMIHLLGRHFNFPHRIWNEFAKTYGYRIEEINPILLNRYRRKLNEKYPPLDLGDLTSKWKILDISSLPPKEPAEIEEYLEATPTTRKKSVSDTDIKSIRQIMEYLRSPKKPIPVEHAPEFIVDPFSAQEIPLAEIIPPTTQ